MRRIKDVEGFMRAADKQVTALGMSRTSILKLPGITSNILSAYFNGRIKRVQLDTGLLLLERLGLEIWVRPTPRTPSARRAYNAEMALWLKAGEGDGGGEEAMEETEEEVPSVQSLPQGHPDAG